MMSIIKFKKKCKELFWRNQYDLMGRKIENKNVNLEWWSGEDNLGDSLSVVVFDWCLSRRNIEVNDGRNVHLMAIGSLIGGARFDAVIWGSGLMNALNLTNLIKHRRYVKYDIRAVRGPITRDFLIKAGYDCPESYGDPAILMPFIYTPNKNEKKYEVSLILHHQSKYTEVDSKVNLLDIHTVNYKRFIDDLCASKCVVSSSLHGIILAETYGIPAIFLNQGISDQSMKFLDWYYSTGRTNIKMASSVSEALKMKPMELPDLSKMQEELIRVFPYDLWEKR